MDVCTHTGGKSRAGEDVGVEMSWEMKIPKESKPAVAVLEVVNAVLPVSMKPIVGSCSG